MPTGSSWIVANPKRPYTELDVEAVLDYTIDWSLWLLEIGATIATHSFHSVTPLEVVQSIQVEGDTQVLFRVKVDPILYVERLHLGYKIPVTCHIVTSDGQEEDQTLWFKLVEH